MTPQQFVYVTYIKASPESLWAALTDPGFGGHTSFGQRLSCEWRKGAEITSEQPDGSRVACGVVLEATAPTHLRLQWRVSDQEGLAGLPDTLVNYEIEPLGEVLRLTLIESYAGPVPDDYIEGAIEGWPVILSRLKTLLETGSPLPGFVRSA